MGNDDQEKEENEKIANTIMAIMVRKEAEEANDEKRRADWKKEHDATVAAILAMRDDIRIMDAVDRDAVGIRSCKQWSEVELAQNGVVYSSLLLTMIREFTPRLNLTEMQQVKDLLYGLMIHLLRFQHRNDFKGVPLMSPGNMLAIRAATRILLDIPTNEGKLLAHYLGILEAFVRRTPRDKKNRGVRVLMEQLTLECDERFGELIMVEHIEGLGRKPLEFLAEKLDEMVGENVKGRGKNRIVGTAAQLAIKVGAWGFDKLDSDSKKNLDAAREKLFQAQKRERGHKRTGAIDKWENVAAEQTHIIEAFENWAKENGRELDSDDKRFPRVKAAREALAIANEQLTMLREQKRRK